ncbi:hypothetical protein Tco_0580829 [Tanacetum coccineum]
MLKTKSPQETSSSGARWRTVEDELLVTCYGAFSDDNNVGKVTLHDHVRPANMPAKRSKIRRNDEHRLEVARQPPFRGANGAGASLKREAAERGFRSSAVKRSAHNAVGGV